MSRERRLRRFFYAAMSCAMVYASQLPARASEADRLKTLVGKLNALVGKTCPSKLENYNMPALKDYCSQNCNPKMAPDEFAKCSEQLWDCMDELKGVQDSLMRYNDWVFQCTEAEHKKRLQQR